MNNNDKPSPSTVSIGGRTFDRAPSASDFDATYAGMTVSQLERMRAAAQKLGAKDPASAEVAERLQMAIDRRKA